jgi:hypothetical protein
MESDRFQLVRFLGAKLGRCWPPKLPVLREPKNHHRIAPEAILNAQNLEPTTERSAAARSPYTSMFLRPDDSSTRRRPYTTPMWGGRRNMDV